MTRASDTDTAERSRSPTKERAVQFRAIAVWPIRAKAQKDSAKTASQNFQRIYSVKIEMLDEGAFGKTDQD